MCGRAACTLQPGVYSRRISRQAGKYNIKGWRDIDKYKPSFNASPGTYLPVVYKTSALGDGVEKEAIIQPMRWGLIPSFGPIANNYTLANARIETVREKLFNRLLDTRRCVVFVDGFYEWQRQTPTKKAYFVTRDKGQKEDVEDCNREETELLALAGLWDCWENGDGEAVFSFTIVTTDSSSEFSVIHDRLPIVLRSSEDVQAWLDIGDVPFAALERRIVSPDKGIYWYRVSPMVNSTKNNSEALVKRFNEKDTPIGKFLVARKMADEEEVDIPVDEPTVPVNCLISMGQTETQAPPAHQPPTVQTQPLTALPRPSPSAKGRKRPSTSTSPPPKAQRTITEMFKKTPK